MDTRIAVILGTHLYIIMIISSGYSIFRMRRMLSVGFRQAYPTTSALVRLSLGIFTLALFSVVILNLYPEGEPASVRNWLVIPTLFLAYLQVEIALLVRKREIDN